MTPNAGHQGPAKASEAQLSAVPCMALFGRGPPPTGPQDTPADLSIRLSYESRRTYAGVISFTVRVPECLIVSSSSDERISRTRCVPGWPKAANPQI
jgi:hypothetical protein